MGAFTMRQEVICLRTGLAVIVATLIGLFTPGMSQATLTGICAPAGGDHDSHGGSSSGHGGDHGDQHGDNHGDNHDDDRGAQQQIGFCNKSLSVAGSLLTITLTNTSPAANGGFIVADAFDLPYGVSATLASTTNSHFGTFLQGEVKTEPYEHRTDIISLGGTLKTAFEGAGGSPNGGISVGQSATFVFNLVGGSVNETDVFNSELVRFKGFNDGKSDKTGVAITGHPPTTTPEPTTLLLVGPGLAGLFWLRRKLR